MLVTVFPPVSLCQENESSCQAQLGKFPLVVQTPLLQRRVEDLNAKLKEIDAAKAIFGRARVGDRGSVVIYLFFIVKLISICVSSDR